MGRRLMYFWNMLNKGEGELAFSFFQAQKLCPSKNDWIKEVENDFLLCDINLSEGEIKGLSKNQYKRIVQAAIKKKSNSYLTEMKNKKSKISKLKISENTQ